MSAQGGMAREQIPWQGEDGRWRDYPRSWYGTWFRPGAPHGTPSMGAKVATLRMILEADQPDGGCQTGGGPLVGVEAHTGSCPI